MALTRGIFPRDEQGNLLSKKGCPTCSHPTWHVCLVGKENKFDEAVEQLQQRLKRKKRAHPGATGSQLQALQDGRNDRWERYREENFERDQKIVARYRDDKVGLRQIGIEFGISYQTVRNALLYYGVPLRPKGVTLKNGAK